MMALGLAAAPRRIVVAEVLHTPPRHPVRPWQVAALVAWQLGGPGATVRRLRRAAERLARTIPSHPATLAEAKRRAEAVLDAVAALDGPDRLPVVFRVLRDLLDDVAEAQELDEAIAGGAAHHRVAALTDAQHAHAAHIVAEATR
jgi:hypothetical protein